MAMLILLLKVNIQKSCHYRDKAASVGSDLIPLSENAINQVENKDYAFPFLQNSMTQSIFAYGIAFSGKNCLVACKKLK